MLNLTGPTQRNLSAATVLKSLRAGEHNGPRTTSHWAVTKLDGEPVNYDEYWHTGRYPHDGMTQYDIVYREEKRCQLHEDLKKALGVVSQLQQDNAALEERTRSSVTTRSECTN
jgi:hypothetical protein